MNVLVIDIGGTNIKMLVTGQTEPRKFPSGPPNDSGTHGLRNQGANDRLAI